METSLFSPLIVGFVAAVNGIGLPKRFSPFVAIGVGVFIAWHFNQDLWQGVIAGLVASGLWSGTKATLGK